MCKLEQRHHRRVSFLVCVELQATTADATSAPLASLAKLDDERAVQHSTVTHERSISSLPRHCVILNQLLIKQPNMTFTYEGYQAATTLWGSVQVPVFMSIFWITLFICDLALIIISDSKSAQIKLINAHLLVMQLHLIRAKEQ